LRAVLSPPSRLIAVPDLDLKPAIEAEDGHGEIMSRVTGARTFLGGKPTRLQIANKQSRFCRGAVCE
jgi:hypothetical protein